MSATLFAFQNDRVRVFVDDVGEPWFANVDVCRVLEISNPSDAISSLDDEEKGVATTDPLSNGGAQCVRTVNESGLYSLIFKSRKPEAKAFKRWVTKEVLPTIRRTGAYTAAPVPALPRTFVEALRALADAEEQKCALTLENRALKPKAEFFDAVTASDDTLSMNESAKLIGIGRNRLMEIMRVKAIFRPNNTPYQRHIDAGYFKVVEGKWTNKKDGSTHVQLSTRCFQRGIDFMRRVLNGSAPHLL